MNFTINWASYVWMTVLIYLFQRPQTRNVYLLFCLCLLFVGKLHEEFRQFRASRSLRFYFFDKWNAIDFMYLVTLFIYRV